MAQVIIVSNRLPVSVKKENGKLVFHPSVGGLATGLSSYVKDRNNLWIGWPGISSDELTDRDKKVIVTELKKHNCSPVFLTRREVDHFYNGYSNAMLWPLFHNLPYVEPAKHKLWWQAYRKVNDLFAFEVIRRARSSSRIWVHDYQLLLLPEMLRDQLPKTNIGFFLHIPFPDVKTLSRLKEHKKLLRGMLGADLIGFHTPGYVKNFLDNTQANNFGVAGDDQVVLSNRVVRVADFPMGIDYKKYSDARQSKSVKAAVKKFRHKYRGKKIIVAVDRLDPSKGLAERLIAYKKFLEQNPSLLGEVVFSMVAAPSRTDIEAYQRLAKRLDKLVADINQTFGTPKWQPVDYMNQSQPFEVVTALFQIADVAFIAPLRDGMNLAAKEFVASNRMNGVLILSQTAGAAEELGDALLVNPRKPASLVDALQQSLTIPKPEIKLRLNKMKDHLSRNTVQAWAKTFVDTLQQPVPGSDLLTRSLKGVPEELLIRQYVKAKKRLLLLDYDGSLVPFSDNLKDPNPGKRLLAMLEELGKDERNEVVVVSGRSARDLEAWLGHLPIHLVAEHGAAIRKAGHKWQLLERVENRWKHAIEPILLNYAAQTPGAQVEVKLHSLVWHYRGASPYYAQKYTVTIKKVLKPLLKKYGVQMFQGNKILEIKNPHISKGEAIQRWLKKPHDFILVVGDDFTDEDMFKVMPASAYSIKVGRGMTAARFRLESTKEIKNLLTKLTK
jgi:trehalose 6-phosphate synthase/phosphatase